MKRILTAAQMKQADRNTIETMGVPSLVLMERAALSCVEELQNGTWDTGKVLAVCGPGNNGGDGAAIARILKTKGVDAEEHRRKLRKIMGSVRLRIRISGNILLS